MLLKILVCGVALSSIWFWLFALLKRDMNSSILKWWLKVVVPQGILIAYALLLIGVL